jgi:hypothetical protein
MSREIFRRKEQKYILTDTQRQAMEALLREYMQPDRYGCSTVCSLYLDTPDYRLIRRSLAKPVYKEKLRLRSYGQAGPDTMVFLELKKKYKGIVYKRRILLPAEKAECYLAHPAEAVEDSQIGREIHYTMGFYPDIAPRVYLCCDRVAWVGRDDPALRLTFDRNIRWRADNLSLTAPPGGESLLADNESLLEIKALGAMPLWMARFLSQQRIRQVSFSKYGRAYEAIARKSKESRGIPCA